MNTKKLVLSWLDVLQYRVKNVRMHKFYVGYENEAARALFVLHQLDAADEEQQLLNPLQCFQYESSYDELSREGSQPVISFFKEVEYKQYFWIIQIF